MDHKPRIDRRPNRFGQCRSSRFRRDVVRSGSGRARGAVVAPRRLRVLHRHDPVDHPGLPAPPQTPNIGEAYMRPYQDAARIAADPAYGTVVCFCERVTEGEIRDAYASLIPPAGLDGLRRRTRAMNGRCQGFFCGAEIAPLADAHRCVRRDPVCASTAKESAG